MCHTCTKNHRHPLLLKLNVCVCRWIYQFQWLLEGSGDLGHVPLSRGLSTEEPKCSHPRPGHHDLWPGQTAARVHDPGIRWPVGRLQQRGGRAVCPRASRWASLWRQEHRPAVVLPRLPGQHHRHGGEVQKRGGREQQGWRLDLCCKVANMFLLFVCLFVPAHSLRIKLLKHYMKDEESQSAVRNCSLVLSWRVAINPKLFDNMGVRHWARMAPMDTDCTFDKRSHMQNNTDTQKCIRINSVCQMETKA